MRLTTLCYLEQDGKYLMLHRIVKKNDVNKDKWIGIGGKFEPGESPEDCVLREAREETGFLLTSYRLRGCLLYTSICSTGTSRFWWAAIKRSCGRLSPAAIP